MANKMFKSVYQTWNVQTGCEYGCSYCHAKTIAERQKKLNPTGKYKNGFAPSFWEPDMEKTFSPGKLIFVSFMGDLFGPWVPDEIIQRIIDKIRSHPDTDFLLLTKNPARYHSFSFPPNIYLGTTTETTNGHLIESKAPQPLARLLELSKIEHPKKFISIEPIMNFDLTTMKAWIRQIMPAIVEVGADNYHNDLNEPPFWKVELLIAYVRSLGITVNEKPSLERLKNG